MQEKPSEPVNGNGKTVTEPPKATISPADAIKEIRNGAVSACAREVEAVLAKHECQLVGIPALMPDGSGGWKTVVRVDVVYKQ